MKTTSPLLAIVSLLLALTPPASAQEAAQIPLVTTSGSALVRVVPDLADLSFEVEVRHADLALARKDAAQRTIKVLVALRAAGLAETELQTSQVQIEPNYINRREPTEKIRFYAVSQTITCTLRDVKKITDITAEAVAAGATGVHAASLRSTELRQHRDRARLLAIRAAREKAGALAGELGAKVGKPYSIIESGGASSGLRANTFNTNNVQAVANDLADPNADNAQGAAFAPGTIGISANIQVSFLLE